MANQLVRNHPLETRLAALDQLPDGFSVTVEPYRTMTNLRLTTDEPRARAGVASVIGVEPPTQPNTWRSAAAAAAIWLGPGEWLVVSDLPALAPHETDLRSVVTPFGGAAVDVSGQRITLILRGRHVRDVLAKGCPMDLHPSVFGPGSSGQTTLGRAGIILLAGDDSEQLTVLVRHSFAPYLADWLIDAAEEFRTE